MSPEVCTVHVLVCDDDSALRFVVKRWLTTTLGCVVSESGDGVQALEALDHQNFDLLVLDLEMPRLSGMEVVEAIRESGHCADLPIVVLSNERRQEIVKQVMDLGVSDYLLKPLRATVIRDRIGPLLSRSRRRRRAAATVLRQLGPETTALLVDGDANFRHVFASVATQFGPMVTADSGADALAAFRASPVDVVFVGRELGIIGAEAMMRKIRDVANVPPCFICVAGLDEAAAQAAGFDGRIERSYQPDVLIRGLQPFVRHVGPLTEMREELPGFEHSLDSAVPQVLGMMADLAVSQVEGPASLPGEGLQSTLTTEVGRFSLEVTIAMTMEVATAVAARMLACEPAEVDAEGAASTLSEIANMITGRVDVWLKEKGRECRTTLPDTRPIGGSEDAAQTSPGEGFTLAYALGAVPGTVVLRAQVRIRA